jgi:hypothetical protein
MLRAAIVAVGYEHGGGTKAFEVAGETCDGGFMQGLGQAGKLAVGQAQKNKILVRDTEQSGGGAGFFGPLDGECGGAEERVVFVRGRAVRKEEAGDGPAGVPLLQDETSATECFVIRVRCDHQKRAGRERERRGPELEDEAKRAEKEMTEAGSHYRSMD